MTGHTAVRPAGTGRRRAGPPARRRRSTRGGRGWLVLAGLLAVIAAGTVGVLAPLAAVVLGGALVTAAAGGSDRAVARGYDTNRLGVAMVAGYLAVWLVVALAHPYPRLALWPAVSFAPHPGPVPAIVVAVAVLVVAAPLAMPLDAAAPAGGYVARRDVVLAATGGVVLLAAQASGTTYQVLAVAALAMPLVLLGTRGWRARPAAAGRRPVLPAVLLVIFFGLVAAAGLPGTYDILPGGATLARVAIPAGAAFGALLALATLAGRGYRRLPVAVSLLAGAASVLVGAQLVATYLAPAGPTVLSAPFAGDWYVVQGGHSELVNAHRADPAQHEALDFVQWADARTHPARPSDYATFDAPVLAPADGVVVYLSDRPDHAAGSGGSGAGNQIVIDLGGGRYLDLAHLEQNSALVNVGDRVTTGDAVARVGNSGASTEPHLQLQVQDSPRADLQDGGMRTFPVVFRGVTLLRGGQAARPATADLRRGDRLHADTW